MKFALVGAGCEAGGHPSNCTPTPTGSAESTKEASVTVNGTPVATTGTAELVFSSHAHDYNDTDGCISMSSHNLTPEKTSDTVTLNGEPLFIEDTGVATDPGAGSSVNMTGSGGNSSVDSEK